MKGSVVVFAIQMMIAGLFVLSGCADDLVGRSATIGAAGGEVSIPGGASVNIPAGALSGDVEIEVKKGGWPSDVDYAASPVWHFGPDGLAFNKPVEVTIPVASGMERNDLGLFWSLPGSSDEYEVVAGAQFSESGDSVTAQINHFSSGYVGSGNQEFCQERYQKSDDDVITDTVTGLLWFRGEGFLADNHSDSKGYCSHTVNGTGGYFDWRLPTLRELLGLISGCGIQRDGCCMPEVFGECGTNAQQLRASYWTDTYADEADHHYAVDYSTCDWSYSSQSDGGLVGNLIASFYLCVSGESTVCQPMCGARECGPDPVCGQSCGTCDDGYSCQAGECVEDACVPACGTAVCGMDPVCGTQNCGTCGEGYSCDDGECVEDTGWEPDDYTVSCSNGMCLIPAGSFWMGCNNTVDNDCDSDESPYHEVTLSGYYMDKTEVTQSAYRECVDAGVCDTPTCDWDPAGTPNRPVVCVNWTQAGEYCAWAGKRLPTEAEWEKAARGTDGRKYPWGNEDATCEYAVMDDSSAGGDGCGTGTPWPVCSKSPAGDSPYGLCDMSGNVWEWVSDWYDSGYYTNSPASNPTGPVSGSYRVLRGGSFAVNYYDSLRASNRYDYFPSFDYYHLGFRCVRPQ